MSLFGLHPTETFEALKLIQEGEAVQGLPRFPGDICLQSPEKSFRFADVSSVFFFDEVFMHKSCYPYMYSVYEEDGLFECIGSSYLERLQEDMVFSGKAFTAHRHFVYFDRHFLWHITAGELVEVK
jgi:hypothetical protein